MVPRNLLMTDSKEANEARAAARLLFGLGRDYKFVKPARLPFTVEVNDPNYFLQELGSTVTDWYEL
jgi:hypothetical protein